MKLLIVLAALVVVAFACHNDHECGHLTNCHSHQRPVCDNGACTCFDHHVGKREPGTCTDDDFSSCTCEHGGSPACKHGHCHCNHHAAKEPGTCTDDDFSNCSCEHGGTPACFHGHCHCNHH